MQIEERLILKKKTKVIISAACVLLLVLSLTAGILIYKNNTAQASAIGQSNFKKYWWDKDTKTISNLKSARNTVIEKLPDKFYTGHTIYLDAENKPFIISGDSVMYLTLNVKAYELRPIDIVNLREEYTGVHIEVFNTQDAEDAWKSLYFAKDGNVTINEYKALKLKVDSSEDELYIEALPAFDELNVKYTKTDKQVALEYTTNVGKTLKFTVPIGNKGDLFTDSQTKIILKTAYLTDDGKVMIERGVLKDLLGFEISGGGVGNNQAGIVSDYADMKVPVVKQSQRLDTSKFYKRKSDGTYEDTLTTGATVSQAETPKVGVSSQEANQSPSSEPTKVVGSKAPVSGGSKPSGGSATNTPSTQAPAKTPSQTPAQPSNDTPKTIEGDGCTLVVLHGEIIHCYYKTIVGTIDVGKIGSETDAQIVGIVAAKFRAAHPDWPVSVGKYGVSYVRPSATDVEDNTVMSYCGGDPASISSMSANKLYGLAKILPDSGGSLVDYAANLSIAWNKMGWEIAKNPYGRTVNGVVVG